MAPLGPAAPFVQGAGGMLVHAPGGQKKNNPPVFQSGKPVTTQVEVDPPAEQPKPEFNEEDFNQVSTITIF